MSQREPTDHPERIGAYRHGSRVSALTLFGLLVTAPAHGLQTGVALGPATSAEPGGISIAVMPLASFMTSDDGRPVYVGPVASALLRAELAGQGSVDVRSGESIKSLLAARSPMRDYVGDDGLREAGRLLSVDWVVWGPMAVVRNDLRVDLRVIETASTRSATLFRHVSTVDSLPHAVALLSEMILDHIGAESEGAPSSRPLLPRTALVEFARGLAALEDGRLDQAEDHLRRVAEVAPGLRVVEDVLARLKERGEGG